MANTCSVLKKVGFYLFPKLTTSKSSNYYKLENYLMKCFSMGNTIPTASALRAAQHAKRCVPFFLLVTMELWFCMLGLRCFFANPSLLKSETSAEL